jgi:hypothetical protein
MDLRKPMLVAALVPLAAFGADEPDRAREDMQRSLNERVMAAPFNPGDIKKAQAWAEDAKKQGVAPQPQPPSYWVPGWTCANLTVYAVYLYNDYRNCIYYHHYYGYYWR